MDYIVWMASELERAAVQDRDWYDSVWGHREVGLWKKEKL